MSNSALLAQAEALQAQITVLAPGVKGLPAILLTQGLSGTGKTQNVKKAGWTAFSADDHFKDRTFSPAELPAAHKACLEGTVTAVVKMIEEGKGDQCVCVDNTNLTDSDVYPYSVLAQETGASLCVVKFPGYDDVEVAKQRKKVPEGVVEAQKNRMQDLAHTLPALQQKIKAGECINRVCLTFTPESLGSHLSSVKNPSITVAVQAQKKANTVAFDLACSLVPGSTVVVKGLTYHKSDKAAAIAVELTDSAGEVVPVVSGNPHVTTWCAPGVAPFFGLVAVQKEAGTELAEPLQFTATVAFEVDRCVQYLQTVKDLVAGARDEQASPKRRKTEIAQ